MSSDILFFDIEVYHSNAFVVFKDIDKRLKRVFHNNFVGLENFIQEKTLVGFNNYFYDDHILHAMLDLKTPYQIKSLNDRIIGGERPKIKNYRFNSLDVFQQIDVSMPSLKRIEGNLGRMILESSVPFTIDRVLTDDEYADVLDYCIYDVDTTIDAYKMRVNSYFAPKKSLLEMLGDDKGKRWNTTTLSANVLLQKPLLKWSNIRIPEEMLELVPPEVVELWLTKEKGSVTVKEFGCDIEFSFGGLHGVNPNAKRTENVKLLDVASLYPNIIINIKALGHATESYKDLIRQRIEVKHTDKTLSDALKLVLNSVYGNLNNQYSLLHNPKAALSVCVYGQIVLYDLCKRLSPFVKIIQVNTDGVAFTTDNDIYKQVWKDWESDYNLALEEDKYDLFIQKDVNGYIAKTGDSLKCKGSDVNKYGSDQVFKNNNTRILHIALVDKLIYGKDVIETLTENLDKPHLYQYILQAGGTYMGTYDSDGVKHQKVNRVFAAKKGDFCLHKKRHDLGLVKFPNSPSRMYLWNGECDDIENFEDIVDLNHYYQLVMTALSRWT